MQNSLIRLVVALALAVAAGLGNFFYMTMKSAPMRYVRFSKEVGLGEVIVEDESLAPISISGDSSQLNKSLLPWEERVNIVGRRASRVFEKDSLALKQDFLGKGPQWRVLGPFELVSVGERVREAGREFSEGSGGQAVTIKAYVEVSKNDPLRKETFTPDLRELMEVLYSSSESKNSIGKIVAVQLYPGEGSVDAPKKEGVTMEGREFIVPLKEVASIPEVLVRGNRIGFVVKL